MQKTVLIADDSMSVRKFVMLALKLQGVRVISAVDGMDALEKAAIEKVDLLITDLNMPNMDGYTLIKNLRSTTDYGTLPIIILSSLSKDADVQAGLDAGANSYLIKPFNAKRLQYEVSKYIG